MIMVIAMIDFSTTTRIYKLCSTVDDKIYIGSTNSNLHQRFYQHKIAATRYPTRKVYAHFNQIGWANVRIEELELYAQCRNVNDKRWKEQEWIDLLSPELNTADAWGQCQHGRSRNQCKPCHGANICEHNKRRSRCRPCGGSAFCGHGRNKAVCSRCNPKVKCWLCDCVVAKASIAGHVNTQKHKFMLTLVDPEDLVWDDDYTAKLRRGEAARKG